MMTAIEDHVDYVISFDPGSWVGAYAVFGSHNQSGRPLLFARAMNFRKDFPGTSDLEISERCAMVGRVSGEDAFHRVMDHWAPNDGRPNIVCVAEYPRIYPGSQARPDSMLGLAACVGAFAVACGGMRTLDDPSRVRDVCLPWFVTPPQWKGNEPPDMCAARIIGALSSTGELDTPVDFGTGSCDSCSTLRRSGPCTKKTACVAHNVVDAIGIGLWALGRFEPAHSHGLRRGK